MKELTEVDILVVKSYAKNNMNALETAKQLFFHHNNVYYHLDSVKKKTGFDPRNFYDLVLLLKGLGILNDT